MSVIVSTRPAVLSTVEAVRLAVPLATLDWIVVKNVKLEGTESGADIPVVSPVVVTTIHVTRLMELVFMVVTQATQGDSVKIPVALHVVGRTTLVTRLMEPVHRDVTQATQGDSVKIPVALHVVGRTTLVTRLMEPVHRDVIQATQGDFVSQCVLTGLCPRGRYGHHCAEACSDHCAGADNTCNYLNGSCDQGCDVGYLSPLCKDICPLGKYGPRCNTTCSGQCVGQHNPCHHIDGSCYLGCVQDDQSPMCRRTRGSRQKTSSFFVPLVAVVTAAAVIIGLLVWRLRMATSHQPQRSPHDDCSARAELVQVENTPLAPSSGTLAGRGLNQQYEPMELSPLDCLHNDNDHDQYATPLDMERELGEYEMPLALSVKQSDLSEHSGENISKTEKNTYANTKPCKAASK
ncbi:hypothetical protein RRG08_065091 [Elysia crispata]|uniref:Uncharacterized protein n=1 Tax=Elysia crispata TaxID=231223 RepID=A0AAE0XMY9_9GAST|nr:hypothetical protein RRG08_065091 [Elysia crispata]